MERLSQHRPETLLKSLLVLMAVLVASPALAADVTIKETGRTLAFKSFDSQEFVGDLVFLSESLVVAGGRSGPSHSLQVFDLRTDRMIQKIPHDLVGIEDLDVSPDGKRVAAAGANGAVLVWNTKDWSVLSRHTLHHRAHCVKFINGATLLASGGDQVGDNKDLVVWNIDRQELHHRRPAHDTYFRSLAISPDGKLLASASNNSELCVWNLTDFSRVSTCRGEGEPTHCLYFFRDSQRIASGNSNLGDPSVVLSNAQNGDPLATMKGWIGIPTAVFGLCEDKYILTVCSIGEFWVYEVATGKEVYRLKSPKGFHSAALSPNGRMLLTTDFTQITRWNIDIPEKAKASEK